MEKLTREELLKKIKEEDVKWFENYYIEYNYQSSRSNFKGNKFKTCWEINWGDGNECIVALDFFEENITVVMEGYYSSHGDSEFDKVGFGVPYEFKETRYRIATLQELRDMKLCDILNG